MLSFSSICHHRHHRFFYAMFCFVLTSPPLMLCVYLQTFEAALFLEEVFTNQWPIILKYNSGVTSISCVV